MVQEHIPIDEVFEQLRCGKEGLTEEEAEARLLIFGHNKLEEKSVLFTLVVFANRDGESCVF